MPGRPFKREQKALLVHPDLKVLSDLQSELSQRSYTCILARDLPTALLAMTQHYFDMGLIAAQITEQGDGWSLSGVFRMVFPKSFVAVLGADTGIRTLQTAINNGINDVYEPTRTPQDIVNSVVTQMGSFQALFDNRASRRVH
jgi:DNA-binding NtrC family response regulator